MLQYGSIASSMFGTKYGGEGCADPAQYGLYQASEKNLTAASEDNPCEERGHTKYDSTETHGFDPASSTWDVYFLAKVEVAPAAEPCCQDNCQAAGRRNCWSIDCSMFGAMHCGVCSVDPLKFGLHHAFENNFTATTEDNHCGVRGYSKHNSTETHGFGPVSRIYGVHGAPKVEAALAAEPCCQGHGQAAGWKRYWSIASGTLGTKHGGEGCMDPPRYNLYHAVEKYLTAATEDNPCEVRGYTKYDSIETHGLGPVSTTLDLCDVPKVEVAPAVVPGCQGHCQAAGMKKGTSMWLLIMCGRAFEMVNGERQLLKQEGRVERLPSHMQPWMARWRRRPGELPE